MVLPRVPLLRSQKLLAAVNVSQIFYYGLTLSRLGCATPRFHFHVLVQEDFYLLVSLIVNVFSICLRVESDVLSFDVGAHNEYMEKRRLFLDIYTKNRTYFKLMSTLQYRFYPLRSAWLELHVCHSAVVYRFMAELCSFYVYLECSCHIPMASACFFQLYDYCKM